MLNSILVKNQIKVLNFKNITTEYDNVDAIITLRYDDQCGNKHNTFSITADIYKAGRPKTDHNMIMCGCCHDFIKKHIQELSHCIKWHLCSSDGPMYYISNTLYHAKAISKHQDKWFTYLRDPEFKIDVLLGIKLGREVLMLQEKYGKDNIQVKEYENSMAKDPNIEYARASAIWPEANLEDLQDETKLKARLPELMAEFKSFIESLGFIY